MDRYVGLDAHAQTCTLAVMGPTGKRLTSSVVETNGHALLEAIAQIPGRIHLCLEEGTQSAWLYEILEPQVAEITVTVPEKSKGSKDDLKDAWKRANEIRTGAIGTRVYKAPKHLTALRSAATAYRMATQDVVRVKNRLKTVFRSRGILAESDVYAARSRTKWLKQLPGGHRELAEWLGRELDTLVPLREEAEERLLKEAKTHPITRTLGTAPGLGPVRTAQLVAIVATPHRFRTSRQFWSYCGLSVVTESSSDWVADRRGQWVRADVQQTRGLTRKRQPVLKAIFKGAATTVITQLVDHPLHADYQRRLPGRHQTQPGQAHTGPSHRSDRAVDVEARGGVRPGATEGRNRQAVEATPVDGEAVLWESGVAQRERFEGEHPLVCWSPGRDGETPNAGYAPSEYQLKPWPIEAQSGAWCPRFAGDHTEGFEVERAVERSSQRAASRESTPSVHSRGLTHRAAGAIVGVSNRPSQEPARLREDSILLTTHFSGADEAGLRMGPRR